jgi:hypothetical protein
MADHKMELIMKGGFGLEPTSVYHRSLAEHLIGQAQQVVLASNEAINKNRNLPDGLWERPSRLIYLPDSIGHSLIYHV